MHSRDNESSKRHGVGVVPAVISMAWSDRDVLELVVAVLAGGRAGGGLPPPPGLVDELLGHTRPPRRATRRGRGSRRSRVPVPKSKRKVSAYQREFGRQLKKLKKAHPRTPVTKLMKRAHAATKRARRGK